MIYILPAPAKTLGMPTRPSGKSANKTLKDAKTIYKQPSPANTNVGKLAYTTGIEVHPCTFKHSPITSCNVRNRSNYK